MRRIFIALAVMLAACASSAAQGTVRIETRKNTRTPEWTPYETQTLAGLPGFKLRRTDPATDKYGGWTCETYEATGFFHTRKIGDRWWIIDPEGHPYIFKGVACLSIGHSDRQQAALVERFGDMRTWAEHECGFLRENGFNGLGAWSRVDDVRECGTPLPYTVIVNPMGRYHGAHLKKFGGKYLFHSWQNYRFDLAMVFDPEFDKYVESEISKIARYKDDPWLVGYYTDNEIPWVNDALDRHLTLLAHDEPAYLAVRKWFDERKGKNAGPADITPEDRLAFSAFYLDTYLSKVTAALRKYDPNHMYLGCRFNQWKEELRNKAVFETAGKYMDIISVNHYQRWTPDMEEITNFGKWSGKPFMVTEFYTKGEDSGLPNSTGAGWNVHTQKERGLFYQNFALALLRSKCCVGWHWFKYMDNDPTDRTTDPSNRNSNKGVVTWDFARYMPLLNHMKAINGCVYGLAGFHDSNVKKT